MDRRYHKTKRNSYQNRIKGEAAPENGFASPFFEKLMLFAIMEHDLDVGQNQGSYAPGFILYDPFSHVLIERTFPHFLISKAGYQADAA